MKLYTHTSFFDHVRTVEQEQTTPKQSNHMPLHTQATANITTLMGHFSAGSYSSSTIPFLPQTSVSPQHLLFRVQCREVNHHTVLLGADRNLAWTSEDWASFLPPTFEANRNSPHLSSKYYRATNFTGSKPISPAIGRWMCSNERTRRNVNPCRLLISSPCRSLGTDLRMERLVSCPVHLWILQIGDSYSDCLQWMWRWKIFTSIAFFFRIIFAGIAATLAFIYVFPIVLDLASDLEDVRWRCMWSATISVELIQK